MFNKPIIIILFLMLMSHVQTRCEVGCLKCSDKNLCLVCDHKLNYFNENGRCKVKIVKECEIPSIDGRCMKCLKDFYLDSVTLKCVAIADTKKIANCHVYNESKSCVHCDDGFYLNNSVCEAVPKAIENCAFYSSTNPRKCEACKPGFVINHTHTSCLKNPEIANCSMYSQFECRECADGYIKDKNTYIQRLFDLNEFTSVDDQYLYTYFHTIERGEIYGFDFVHCSKVMVPNCKKAVHALECAICEDGYYLTEWNSCRPFPLQKIANCHVYLTQNTCNRCDSGFYLAAIDKCLPIIDIENCISYDNTANISLCIRCHESHYLQSNKCVPRVVSQDIGSQPAPTTRGRPIS